jgi:hypothetical protein
MLRPDYRPPLALEAPAVAGAFVSPAPDTDPAGALPADW